MGRRWVAFGRARGLIYKITHTGVSRLGLIADNQLPNCGCLQEQILNLHQATQSFREIEVRKPSEERYGTCIRTPAPSFTITPSMAAVVPPISHKILSK
eukprot:COSAG02_NODE_981_length_15488_cov_27.585093_8_plen_99_part_00